MVESLNTVHNQVIDAVFISGFSKYGQIMVGDRAFEFYKNNKAFQEELTFLLNEYAGRPSLLYYAQKMII